MAENTFSDVSLQENLNVNPEEQSLEGGVQEQQQDSPDQQPVGGPGPSVPSISELANKFVNNTLNSGGPGDGQPTTPPRLSDLATSFINQQRASDRFNILTSQISRPFSVTQAEAARWDDPNKPWRPNVDMEDWYARDEGFLKTTGKGASRLVLGTGLKTFQGVGYTGSLVYNTINDVIHNRWNGADIIQKTSENGFSKFFSGLETDMKEKWLPTYQEASDRDKGFWWRAFNDYDFWMDDVVDGVAFMASAWIPGIALSKLGLGTRVASGLSRLRLGVEGAEATIEGAGAAANYLAKANSVFKTSFDKYTAWAMATSSEALFEATGVKDNIYKSLTYDQYGNLRINPETGNIYTEEEKKKIIAPNVRNTFLLNAALLSGTNMVELNWIGKAVGGAEKASAKALSKGLTGAETLGEELAVKKGPVNFFAKAYDSNIGAFVKGSARGVAVEGFIEENGQLAIQRVNETYGANGRVSNFFNLGDVLGQYASQTVAALKGEDIEASANIGIGGILGIAGGGRSAVRDRSREKAQLNQGVTAFNNSLKSFIKFGDIFKNEDFASVDENGNEIKENRISFDKYGSPEIDNEKLVSVAGGYASVIGALEESNKVNDKFKRDILRDNAWGELVGAHMQLGIEDTLFEKLESARNASAEDLAKLGFSKDETTNAEIDRYKALTTAIIKQHKLLNADIIFSDKSQYSEDELARKSYLMGLATQQAVYKSLVSTYSSDAEALKGQFYDSTTSSLSDGLVDQLNDIQHRINSQKELIEDFRENGVLGVRLNIAQKVLDELLSEKGKIIRENKESVSKLKTDKDEFYKYEKEKRNEPGVEDQYRRKIKLVGDVKNHIRSLGLTWARFADTVDGRQNFISFRKNDVLAYIAKVQEEAAKQQTAEPEEPKEKPGGIISATKKKGKELLKSLMGKVTGEEEEEEEPTGKAANKRKFTYEDEAGEEQAFFFVEGRSYTMEDEDDDKKPIIRTFNIVKVDDENVSYTEGEDPTIIEEPGEDMAEFANTYEWKIVPVERKPSERKPSSRRKSRTEEEKKSGTSRSKSKVKTENPRDLESDTAVETGEDSETFEGDKKKAPKFEVVGFNKTIGLHYIDPGDTVLNTADGSARFFAFTSRVPILPGQYVLRVITIDNDNFKDENGNPKIIRQEQYNTDDVKVVVMKKTVKGKKVTYDYVDEFGNIIPENEVTTENIVYRSLPNMKEASISSVKKLYTVDESTSDDDIRAQIKSHIAHQDNLRKRVKKGEEVYLEVKGKSPGITRVEYSDAIGKNNEPLPMENPVEGRIIEEDPDWSNLKSATNPENTIRLLVNTQKGKLAPGLLPGRAVMIEYTVDPITGNEIEVPGSHVRVFNRMLNEQEKAIITEALARFSELFGRKDDKENPLSPSESNEYTLIFDYLKNVLNWGTPKEEMDPTKFMWIQNGLHVGENVYEFDRETMLMYADEILKDQYHHINNRSLWGRKPFQTIKFVGGKVKIDKKYDTYEEYLLAKREDGTTSPVYTSLPSLDSENPQKTGSYLMWSDPAFTEAEPIGEIERTYPKEEEEKEEKKTRRRTKKKEETEEEETEKEIVWRPVDRNIKKFYEQDSRSLTVNKWQIKRVSEKGKYYVTFTDPKSKKVLKTRAYDSLDELYEDRYKIKSLINKYTGYKPLMKSKGRGSSRSSSGRTIRTKGYIKLGDDFIEKVKDGTATATTRFTAYHNKFYKGDGIYKAEDGTKVRITYLGKFKLKPNGAIFGGLKGQSSTSFKKNQIAENLGYEDWNDLLENGDWSDLELATQEKNVPVNYYEISVYDANDELDNPTEEEEVVDEEEDEKETPTKTKTKSKTAGGLAGLARLLAKAKGSKKGARQKKKEEKPTQETKTKAKEALDKVRALAEARKKAAAKKTGNKKEEEGFEEDDNYERIGDFFLRQDGKKWNVYNTAGELLETFDTKRKANKYIKDSTAEEEESPVSFPYDPFTEVGDVINVISKENPKVTGTLTVSALENPDFIRFDMNFSDGTKETGIGYSKKEFNELFKLAKDQPEPATKNKKGPQGPVFRTSIESMKKTENFKKFELFMAKNLPQFSMVKMSNLIHGKHWGMFYNGAIYIYDKAGYGTGYHEAFEAVFGTYLSEQEQQELVDEFRSRQGTFKNPFTKQTKAYSEATFDDAREMMAEEFIKYVDGTQRITYKAETKIKGFFEELWDSIKALFGMKEDAKVEMKNKINDVYKSITTGKFRNKENTIKERNVTSPVFSAAKNLTQKETANVIEGINYYFFSDIFTKGASISSILEGMSNKESNQFLNDAFQYGFDRMLQNLEDPENPIDPATIERITGAKIPIYDIFKKNLERYGLSFEELDKDEESINDPLGIVDSINVDPRKAVKQNVRILTASLPGIQYIDGEPQFIINSLNQPKLMDGDKINTTLLNELGNIVPIIKADGTRLNVLDQMFEKLDAKYKNADGSYKKDNGWIASLKRRLKYEGMGGMKIDPTTLTEDEMELRVAFVKNYSNLRTNPEKVLMDENGKIYNINPLTNANSDRIKYEWSNNLKERVLNGETDVVVINPQGKMILNRKSEILAELIGLLDNVNAIEIEDSLFILDTLLGVQFSATDEEINFYKKGIIEDTKVILKLIGDGELNDVSEIYGTKKIGGRINSLIDIEARFNNEDNILSYLTPEGEQQYSVMQSNLLGNVINILNTVKNHTELVKTCPWLGYIDEKGQPQLNPYQQESDLLKKGGILFDNKGNRRVSSKTVRKDMTYHIITGMTPLSSDGISTADLKFPERVANKIHFLLNSFSKKDNRTIVFSNINSDKSTESGIGIPTNLPIDTTDVIEFIEAADDESSKITDKYIMQLKDELSAIRFQKEDPKNIKYYRDGVFQLGHFKDILSKKVLDKFNKEVLSDNEEDVVYEGDSAIIDFIEANRKSIIEDVNSYVANKMAETFDFLLDLDIIEQDKKDSSKYITDAISNDILNEAIKKAQPKAKKGTDNIIYSQADILNLAGLLAINEELLITEQHKLIYGHPAIYNDGPKRFSGATSTKEGFVEDADVVAWQDKNMARVDGKIRSEETHATTKVISFKNQDVVSVFFKDIAEDAYETLVDQGVSEEDAEKKVGAKFKDGKIESYIYDNKGEHTGIIKGYVSLDEADAMAWGLPDTIRDMLFSTGKFGAKQKKQFAYEMAYEKLVRSGRIKKQNGTTVTEKSPEYKKYTEEELNAAQIIYDGKDPGYVFQVLKPQYFGYAQDVSYTTGVTEDNFGITHPVFLKHAVQPKFYRHVEGSQYEKLYIAAQKNQVDIIGFVSGQKVGAVTDSNGKFTSIYNEAGAVNIDLMEYEDGTQFYDLPEELPMLRLYSRFYGIQVETNNKPKSSVVRGTQVTKLVMVNFFNNGKPITPELKELIEDYNNTLKKMISLGKERLLEDLGLERTTDRDGNIVYKAKDLNKLIQILRNEARNRDLPDNMIDAINVLISADNKQTLLYSFDTLINRDKIDNILNSIVDSRVISAKMPGKLSTQVASTLYESDTRGYMYIKDGVYVPLSKSALKTMSEDEKKSIKMTSSDLKFYKKGKNGKISMMECYVSWPFSEVTPEELGLKFENGVYKIPSGDTALFDKRLLNIIGFRIPTQSMNSIENIVIKGFTPAANGDMIVVPSEIVGKSGSDFDIDKLNLYMSNAFVEGIDYSTDQFKTFMIKDFVARGRERSEALRLFKMFSVDDFKKINRSAKTEYNRKLNDAPFSLENIDIDVKDAGILKDVKASIQAYNATFKGKNKRLVYREQDDTTKEGLENKLISIMSELISRPENYTQLVTPNTTQTLEDLASDIKDAKVKAKTRRLQNEKSYTYLRTFIGSSEIRERYLTAKRMVGIAAVHSTFHSLAQISGIRTKSTFKTESIKYLMPKFKVGNRMEYDRIKAINIKLNHHAPNTDGTFNIGHRLDVLDRMISDLFSESLSGFVDGAKNPFVFDLNLSMDSAGTWFYLQHHGVPVEEVAYLYAQPIMDSYFDEKSKNKSNFKKVNGKELYNEDLFLKVITPFYDKIFKTNLEKEIATAKADRNPFKYYTLKNKIIKNVVEIERNVPKLEMKKLQSEVSKGAKKADPKFQIAALYNYLQYDAQSRLLSNFMQAISYDNKKTKTLQENQSQVARWKRADTEGFIVNPEAILDNTFLGEMKEQKEDIFNMFTEFFVTLDPNIQKLFEPLYEKINNPEFFSSKEDMNYLLNRYQNFVLTYILHTTSYKNSKGRDETLNTMYEKMVMGKNNLAKTLLKYKRSANPEISENIFIRELLPILADDKNKTNNISLFRNKMDSYKINNMIEALEDLKAYANDTADADLSNFVDDIAKFVIIQSGVSYSYLDYKKVLSTSVYSDLIKTILDNFKGNPEVDTDDVWKSFHQNNWKDRTIVPVAPKWIKFTDGALAISDSNTITINDFLVKTVMIADRSRIESLKKQGKFDEAFETILFQITDYDEGSEKFIYEPVHKMGDGVKMFEIYKGGNNESVIATNNVGVRRAIIENKRTRKVKEEDRPANIPGLYVGGFTSQGKGTEQGDGKDKAMRKVADAAIVELANDNPSSSKTTLKQLGEPDYEKELYQDGMAEIIMLARNGELGGRALRKETMKAIDEAIEKGCHFVVGDMPGVDTPFIEYLLRKNASFQIYGSSKTSGGRISEQMPKLWDNVLSKAVFESEEDESDMPDAPIQDELPKDDNESEC